ncbi:hypothetical protein QBC35DRAFT_454583 [Podospora australis]|uniref:AAA+ ATPase domain-containing protein n=1 Tax=Podospora australis TaxID=1536484 RepID=A0AAN6WMY7_9PEZI|nr:hypothetical protein QBC35DRAFT_454583 [Podospora australis]
MLNLDLLIEERRGMAVRTKQQFQRLRAEQEMMQKLKEDQDRLLAEMRMRAAQNPNESNPVYGPGRMIMAPNGEWNYVGSVPSPVPSTAPPEDPEKTHQKQEITAALNRVSWDEFVHIRRVRTYRHVPPPAWLAGKEYTPPPPPTLAALYAIDVLMEEPVIVWQSLADFWWVKPRSRYVARSGNTAPDFAAKKSQASTNPKVPGQDPLPERIRINSTHILFILEEIHGANLCDRVFSQPMGPRPPIMPAPPSSRMPMGPGMPPPAPPPKFARGPRPSRGVRSVVRTYDSIVMTRPFRGLVVYTDSIRKALRDIEKALRDLEKGLASSKQSSRKSQPVAGVGVSEDRSSRPASPAVAEVVTIQSQPKNDDEKGNDKQESDPTEQLSEPSAYPIASGAKHNNTGDNSGEEKNAENRDDDNRSKVEIEGSEKDGDSNSDSDSEDDDSDTESVRLFSPDEAKMIEMNEEGRIKLLETKLQHIRCLAEFLDTDLQSKMDYLAGPHCKKVTFADVWHMFKPGDEVTDKSQRQAYRVIRVTSPGHKAIPPYRDYRNSSKTSDRAVLLTCIYIDFDGKQIGPVKRDFVIAPYDGEKPVISLEVYPIRFAEGRNVDETVGVPPTLSFRERLVARGKMFLDVASVKHMHYNGLTLLVKDEVDSQVVIDFEEFFASKAGRGWMPRIRSLITEQDEKDATRKQRNKRDTESETSSTSSESDVDSDDECSEECCLRENLHIDGYAENNRADRYKSTLIPENRNKEPSVAIHPRKLQDVKHDIAITDDDFLIMSYRVFGFVLRNRKWAHLDLSYLSPVHANRHKVEEVEIGVGRESSAPENSRPDLAFNQLVLPDGHKQMVLSLIAQHFRDKESTASSSEQFDIVRGKGKGLIILLHGAPGVGKTTTAEGVAELFQKPLFQITCGDLGTTAAEVETALETYFALASRWGCILLLDEADVFLAARTPQDFIRNGMVSVFLRVLEYYSGILFLTTNRIGDFDEAFGSRIHISLHYPQLDLASTVKVFELNLRLIRERFARKQREISIDEKAILEFAVNYWTEHEDMRWNGRQIRNACQTALALAEFSAQGGSHIRVHDANAKISLKLDHLEVVSKAYLEFITYLEDIYDKDADRRAKQMRIRAREHSEKLERMTKGKHKHESVGSQLPSWLQSTITQPAASHHAPAPQHTPQPVYPAVPAAAPYPYYVYPPGYPQPAPAPAAPAAYAPPQHHAVPDHQHHHVHQHAPPPHAPSPAPPGSTQAPTWPPALPHTQSWQTQPQPQQEPPLSQTQVRPPSQPQAPQGYYQYPYPPMPQGSPAPGAPGGPPGTERPKN